jgi:tetratricopeptide (TPR) repeat protein
MKKIKGRKSESATALPKLSQPSSFRATWILSFLLIAMTLIAYVPAWNGKPIWDDNMHMTKPELQTLDGLMRIWIQPGATQQYYPAVHSAFWVAYKLWGDSPAPYHLLNILLHGFSAVLLFRILLRLAIPGAWLAAAIFALHPVQVESVAWISELKNTLSGVLFLSAALFYFNFDKNRRRSDYLLALALFGFALMSKTVTASLPAALLVTFWWKRGTLSWKRDVLPIVPFFVIGAAAGLVTVWVERKLIGAEGHAFEFTIIERFLIAGRVCWFYLGKLLWPADLMFIYPRWEVSQLIWWQYLFPIALFAVLAIVWLLRKRSRAPIAGALLFVGMLFPALGFFNVYPFVYSFVADHFQYLASIGVIVPVTAGLVLLFDRAGVRSSPVSRGLGILLLLGLGILTWRQSRAYTDPITLYRTTLEKNPDCFMAHNNLSVALLEKGQTDDAIVHSQRALEIRPNDAQPHVSLGDALLRKRKIDKAIAHYQAAEKLMPDYVEAHTHLGNAFLLQREFPMAIAEYETTLRLLPRSIPAHNNLAWLLATCADVSLRNGPRAVELASVAAELSGRKDPQILRTLAAAYATNGQIATAIETAQDALRLASARGDNGLAQAARNDIQRYQAALK